MVISYFPATLRGFKDNVGALSLGRWKARGRLSAHAYRSRRLWKVVGTCTSGQSVRLKDYYTFMPTSVYDSTGD